MAVVGGRRRGGPQGRDRLCGPGGQRLVEHPVQRAEGGVVEFVNAAGDGVQHVALGTLGATDGLLVVGVGVDGLYHPEAVPTMARRGCRGSIERVRVSRLCSAWVRARPGSSGSGVQASRNAFHCGP